MVVIIALVALFLIFFLLHKHTGPAHLAMIAGLSVYTMWGQGLAEWMHNTWGAVPLEVFRYSIYLALIVAFPLILYLRSGHGGFSGLFRIAEALIFAAVMTALISEPLAYFFSFDQLSMQISDFIRSIEGTIVVIGVIAAYLDLLFASPMKSRRR